MTNKLRTLMAFSALGLSFAALPVFGAQIEPLRVSVPFSFTAGKTTLPAGDYTVSEDDAHVFLIRGVKTSVLVLGTPGTDSDSEKSALSFHRSDKGYELKVIHTLGRAASLVPQNLNPEK